MTHYMKLFYPAKAEVVEISSRDMSKIDTSDFSGVISIDICDDNYENFVVILLGQQYSIKEFTKLNCIISEEYKNILSIYYLVLSIIKVWLEL